MNLSILNRFAHYIQLRSDLLLEAKRASMRKNIPPINLKLKILMEPHIHEEYIWLLRFIRINDEVTLIDIGGNSGYWCETFLSYYPKTTVYAFEPVQEMYKRYSERFKNNNNITIFNTALGENTEEKVINIAKGFGLSSFHKYSDILGDRNVNFIENEIVKISRLDDFYEKFKFFRTIIKVDVQGFEMHVIKGGLEVFKHADIVIMECSFINEYMDSLPTFSEVVYELSKIRLYPIQFGVFDRSRSPIAYERNVLFVKPEFFNEIWS